MPPPTPSENIIRDATRRLELAQSELATALAELPISERADKRIVTKRLRLALGEIVAAKEALTEVLEPEASAPAAVSPESSPVAPRSSSDC